MIRTVTVLQDDIDHGVRGHAQKCAVARALGRDLADLPGLDCADEMWLYDGRQVLMGARYQTPSVVADFICRFDKGLPVEPFKFEIEIEVLQ